MSSEQQTWWDRYHEYLKSPEWYALRERVMRRADGFCEICALGQPTQVHHTTYKHVFHEFIWELRAVCDRCHARLHRTPTEQKPLVPGLGDRMFGSARGRKEGEA